MNAPSAQPVSMRALVLPGLRSSLTRAGANYEVSARPAPFGMKVTVSGRPTIEQLISTLHVFGIRSESSTDTAMLIDLQALKTAYDRDDLVSVGHEIACSFSHLTRLALLVEPHRVTRVSERTAQRNGMNMRVFDLESLALDWLRQDAFQPPMPPRR